MSRIHDKFSIIVAYSRNRVIGNKGKIPWKIPGEQKRFKRLTEGNVVVMGRKTYEEIGKPLISRINIIISSSLSIATTNDNVFIYKSPEEFMKDVFNKNPIYKGRKIFIIGGESLFKFFMPYVDMIYATEIEAEIEGDTYFPEINENKFKQIGGCVTCYPNNGIDGYPLPNYTYYTYERIRN
jgi:dihydrofolate reductase